MQTKGKQWQKLMDEAQAVVEGIIRKLPRVLALKAKKLPVTYELRPNAGLVRDGIEPDILGLFVGEALNEESTNPEPAQIILFLENLWDDAGGDLPEFRKGMETTYLHELGHYLGLDEEGLTFRGLE